MSRVSLFDRSQAVCRLQVSWRPSILRPSECQLRWDAPLQPMLRLASAGQEEKNTASTGSIYSEEPY